jgi:hypothetical protein
MPLICKDDRATDYVPPEPNAWPSGIRRLDWAAPSGKHHAGPAIGARSIEYGRPTVYLDLEAERDRARLADSDDFFKRHADELVILDGNRPDADLV